MHFVSGISIFKLLLAISFIKSRFLKYGCPTCIKFIRGYAIQTLHGVYRIATNIVLCKETYIAQSNTAEPIQSCGGTREHART